MKYKEPGWKNIDIIIDYRIITDIWQSYEDSEDISLYIVPVIY